MEKSGIEGKDFPVIPLKSKTELKEIIGFTKFKNTSILDTGGYFIPCHLQEGYFRLKLRYPIEGVKYLSPKGSPNYPYITKKVNEMAKEYNPDIPLLFTEGEKKTAKAILVIVL